MKKIALSLVIFLFIFGGLAIATEEVKVPFSAVKSSCYGQIDMSKSEFPLSEVGRECVQEDWLEENAPRVSFTANPNRGAPPLTVEFNASVVEELGGDVVSYEWDFDNGSTDSGQTTTHTFDESGDYTVKLTVTDNDETTESVTKPVPVHFCKLGVPYKASGGLTVTVLSIKVLEKKASYQYRIKYLLSNTTEDQKLTEGHFRIHFKNKSGSRRPSGIFVYHSLFPGDTKTRRFAFEAMKDVPYDAIEYVPYDDSLKREDSEKGALKWKIKLPD